MKTKKNRSEMTSDVTLRRNLLKKKRDVICILPLNDVVEMKIHFMLG